MKKIVAVLIVSFVAGCSSPATPTTKTLTVTSPEPTPFIDQPIPPFVGKPTKSITWDLWGDWMISRFSDRETRADVNDRDLFSRLEDGKELAGRFEESWHPRPRDDKSKLTWVDPIRGETFTLISGDGKGDRLRWKRYRGRVFDFSINQQSYGLLVMTDQDGENYLAVRREGGD